MKTLKEKVLEIIGETPGLTDRQLTNLIAGQHAPQQPVNIAARQLASAGIVARRPRDDGLIGNYPAQGRGRGESASPSMTTTPAAPVSAVVAATTLVADDAFAEDAIKAALKDWLERDGWTCRVAWRRERGVDIEAARDGARWLIEVKGRGSLQAMRVNYFLMILGETLQRMDDPAAKYSIALPDMPQFRGLWARLPALAKARTGITALFADERGGIREEGGGPR